MKTDVGARRGGERPFQLWIWRLLLFVLFAGAVLAVEQCAEMWLLPSITTEQALQQMQPDDQAAETLRLLEWARGLIPVVSALTVVIAALVLFVPGIADRLRNFTNDHI